MEGRFATMPQKRKVAAKKEECEKADPKKKAKSSTKEASDESDEPAKVEVEPAKEEIADQDTGKEESHVKITSSKACQAFAKRHVELEKLVLKAKPDAKITIDIQPKLGSKPDKGSFIVEVKGKKIVDLVAMPRPFDKLKALSMETVAADVVKEL
uniref:Selenoprotein H n=1 Tax=Cryptomonas curvata TaxID=233186 RepID=A0A7S0M605_9CRYP